LYKYIQKRCTGGIRLGLNVIHALMLVCFITATFQATLFAQDAEPKLPEGVRTPEQILMEFDGVPSDDAILELFINASEWDGEHIDVRYPSRSALIELGADAIAPILAKYLSSADFRRRITLDNIVRGIGYPASEYLIDYLKDDDPETRRHAAYLIGDCTFIATQDDPLKLGLMREDKKAVKALLKALEIEKDKKVLRSIIPSLGKMRDPELIDTIAEYLNDDTEPVRLNTAIALGYIPHASAVNSLIGAFDDDLGSVRQAAILSLSSEAMGAVSFDELIISIYDLPANSQKQLCCFDALIRYLENISEIDTETALKHKEQAFYPAYDMIIQNTGTDMWKLRGYAVTLIGLTKNQPDADEFLEYLLKQAKHPFVIGRIEEALDILKTGNEE